MADDDSRQTSVYRYYDDSGALIYVGITGRGPRRQRQHDGQSAWWGNVTRQEIEHHPSRDAALERERELIKEFRPVFNSVHNRPAASRRTFRVPDGTWRAAQLIADARGETVSEVVRRALMEYTS